MKYKKNYNIDVKYTDKKIIR